MSTRQPDTAERASLHYECVAFYNEEAERLDAKELEDWLELLTDDVEYEMPIRVTRDSDAERSDFSDEGFNYREDRSTLEARVERFQSEFAWSEDPPTRTRHHVSNVRIQDDDPGEEFTVRNNLLLFVGQGEGLDSTILSAEREDVLRRVDGDLELAKRDVYLDHTVFPIKNISVFF